MFPAASVGGALVWLLATARGELVGVEGAAVGGVTSFALSSGHATPRSGSGASGALGSSSAASGAGRGCGAGCGGGGEAVCAKAGTDGNPAAAAAHSSRAARTLEPHPLIKQ